VACRSEPEGTYRGPEAVVPASPEEVAKPAPPASQDERMAWWREARFGMFVHWGVSAVLGGSWNGKEYPGYAEHIQRVAKIPVPVYHEQVAGAFNPVQFDADAWVRLAKETGMGYFSITAKHHDGFAMYDSALTRWDAKDMGPHRDLIGDLAAAVRHEGLVFGLSQHRMEHWSFMWPAAGLENDIFDPAYADFYGPPQPPAERAQAGEVFEGRAAPQSPAFLEEWLRRNQELVDKYQPQLVYFDNGVNARALDPIKLRFAAYLYNRAAERGVAATIATKRDAYLAGSVKDYERGRPPGISDRFWQCDTSIGHNSWGYVDNFYCRNAGELIRELVDCVAKNGGYLLNIAPRADGTIPEDQQLRLLQIGEWLRLNGEAIYGSRPWHRYGEGPTVEKVNERTPERGITNGMLSVYTAQDMRFTTQRHADGTYTLYATLAAMAARPTSTHGQSARRLAVAGVADPGTSDGRSGAGSATPATTEALCACFSAPLRCDQSLRKRCRTSGASCPPGALVHCTVRKRSGTRAAGSLVPSITTGKMKATPLAMPSARWAASSHSMRK